MRPQRRVSAYGPRAQKRVKHVAFPPHTKAPTTAAVASVRVPAPDTETCRQHVAFLPHRELQPEPRRRASAYWPRAQKRVEHVDFLPTGSSNQCLGGARSHSARGPKMANPSRLFFLPQSEPHPKRGVRAFLCACSCGERAAPTRRENKRID